MRQRRTASVELSGHLLHAALSLLSECENWPVVSSPYSTSVACVPGLNGGEVSGNESGAGPLFFPLEPAELDIPRETLATSCPRSRRRKGGGGCFTLAERKPGGEALEKMMRKDWPNLTRLSIAFNDIGELGAMVLARRRWPHLQELDLRCACIGNEGARHLASGNWPCLLRLELGANGISDFGVTALALSQWPNLEYLSLRKNEITSDGVHAIACGNLVESLSSLDISENSGIGDRGATRLAACQWPNLEWLNLHACSLSKDGVGSLARGVFPALSWLNLMGNNNPDEQAYAVAARDGGFPQLQWLSLECSHEASCMLFSHGIACSVPPLVSRCPS